MNSKFYKNCAVPECKNTTITTPEKLFIHVPRTKKMRNKWCQLARRDPALISTQSKMYFCEDHFDLPNDMANYSEYHLMGKVSQIRLRPGCLPRKFGCQPDRKKRTESKATRPLVAKRKRLETIAECVREIEQTYSINPSVSLSQSTAGHRPPQVSTEHSDPLQTPSRPHQESCVDNRSSMLEFVTHFCKRLSTPDLADEQTHSSQDISMVEVKSELSSDMLEPVLSSPITMDKSIQVLICHKFRSKSTQTSTSFIKCCEHTCHRKPVNSWEI